MGQLVSHSKSAKKGFIEPLFDIVGQRVSRLGQRVSRSKSAKKGFIEPLFDIVGQWDSIFNVKSYIWYILLLPYTIQNTKRKCI